MTEGTKDSNNFTSLSPAVKAVSIASSDSADIVAISEAAPRALYIGTPGDLHVLMADDSSAVIFRNVPTGILAIRVKRIYVTGTTAANIIGLY